MSAARSAQRLEGHELAQMEELAVLLGDAIDVNLTAAEEPPPIMRPGLIRDLTDAGD